MSTDTITFWSDDIATAIARTPLAVLRQAGGELTKLTQGRLEGVVASKILGDRWVEHRLSIEAPGLDRYSVTLLSLRHNPDLVYPCHVDVSEIACDENRHYDDDEGPDFIAAVEPELVRAISKIVQGSAVRSIVYSLLARLNEMTDASA